jgi:putative CocE/NonD family hydrolase
MSTDGLVIESDVMVPMRDGVRLRADLFRPAGAGPFPVLVQRHPYSAGGGAWAMLATALAGHGYAVVVQSCRGRYGSEGEFYPLHPDIDDGYDTIEWAAVQPWSNGRVGMYGVSYSGMTQWLAALAQPPHLCAIAPLSCSSLDNGGWYYAPGVFTLGLALDWSAGMTPWAAQHHGVAPPLPGMAEAERISEESGFGTPETGAEVLALQQQATGPLFKERPLRDIEAFRELAPWFRDWCDHDDPSDPFWQAISAGNHVHEIDLPAIHGTGWADFFLKGSLDAFVAMRRDAPSERTRRAQSITLGPWNHMGGQNRPDADPDAGMFVDLSPDGPLVRFLARHVKGEDHGPDDDPPVRLYVMGENAWRNEHEWPLAHTSWTPFYLHGSGGDRSLSTTLPGDDQPDSYVYDPRDPAPGAMTIGPAQGDPVDLQASAARADVLVYETTPLGADLEITGPVRLELWASSSVEDTDFTAKLVEVFADGSAVRLCQGIVRTGHRQEPPRVPGAVYQYTIELWPTSVLVKAGHRIRLDISSSEFPTFDLNPNTGERITRDGSGRTVPATQHILHDARHPSHLVLPVIPR